MLLLNHRKYYRYVLIESQKIFTGKVCCYLQNLENIRVVLLFIESRKYQSCVVIYRIQKILELCCYLQNLENITVVLLFIESRKYYSCVIIYRFRKYCRYVVIYQISKILQVCCYFQNVENITGIESGEVEFFFFFIECKKKYYYLKSLNKFQLSYNSYA